MASLTSVNYGPKDSVGAKMEERGVGPFRRYFAECAGVMLVMASKDSYSTPYSL